MTGICMKFVLTYLCYCFLMAFLIWLFSMNIKCVLTPFTSSWRLASIVLGEEQRLDFYGNVQSMLQNGIFGWRETIKAIYVTQDLILDKFRCLASFWCKDHNLFSHISPNDRLRNQKALLHWLFLFLLYVFFFNI